MINNNKLIGHNIIFNNLVELYNKNILPNKILLTGKKGIGKSLVAKHFLNYIYSKNEIYEYDLSNFEINIKNKSFNLFDTNSHPNIFQIFKHIDKKFIEISQIREMINFQNYSSFNNKIRYIFIDDVEYFNLNSNNALLKSIEEPNINVFFILINNSESKIIDTLRSRCIEFKLYLDFNNVKLIVNNYFNEKIYDLISKDFTNFYNSPSFLISLVIFFKENEINLNDIKIEDFINFIIKKKLYVNDKFISNNLNTFIELFFYKNVNYYKKISYKFKEYFYLKLSRVKKYNLDLESFFLEFKEELLSE